MKNKTIPDYTSFFSTKAIELVKWSNSENNRIKARKIYRAACRVEYYYRKDQTGLTSPDVHTWSGGCYQFATKLWMIGQEERLIKKCQK
jgi:formate-dependent nitrite reductase cytochrome c552 subunit